MRRLARGLALFVLLPALALTTAALRNGRVEAATRFDASPLLASPPPPLGEAAVLRLVTFNVADGYLFTTNRAERMRAIADLLRHHDPDVVGLQEAFVAEDRERLREALRGTRLVHEVRFPSATVGNGLWILSAFPIEEAWFHRYAHSNHWYQLWEGDWWAGKGVGLARLRLPGGGVVDFFNTHAQAGRGNPDNEEIRLEQMRELAGFVNAARTGSGPAFVVGDLNTGPGRPDYELAVQELGLTRAMTLPSRIDHILAVRDQRYRFDVLETVELTGRTPGSGPAIFVSRPPTLGELWRMLVGEAETTALSDHPGYLATIRVRPIGEPARSWQTSGQ